MATLPAFLAWEAVQVANEGGIVVILSKQPKEVIADLLNNGAQDLHKTVRQANGNEGIDFHTGGQVRIVRQADWFRGYSAKLAIIPVGTTHTDMLTIIPSISTTGGDIVGYY